MPRRINGMPYLDFPQMTPMPWHILKKHERQAKINHGQSLEYLAERGGLSVSEMLAVLEDRPWQPIDDVEAISRITAIVRGADMPRRVENCRANVAKSKSPKLGL